MKPNLSRLAFVRASRIHLRRPIGSGSLIFHRPGLRPGVISCVLGVLLSGIAAARALAAEAEGGRRSERDGPRGSSAAGGDFHHWGKLGGTVSGTDDWVALSYSTLNEKGRKVSEKTMVRIADEAELYADQQIRLEQLQVNESVYILGKAVARDIPSRRGVGGGGSRGKDYQIQAARVILAGDALDVKLGFEDPKDKAVKWHKAVVTKSSAGLSVRYESNEYRVTLEPSAPIFRRMKCEKKYFKSGRMVLVHGSKADVPDQAAKKSTTPTTAVVPRRLVLLDSRYLTTAYAAILP